IFQVLSRALAKTPEERFGSVKAFAQALSTVKRRDEKQKRFYQVQQRKIQAQQQKDASSAFIQVPELPEQIAVSTQLVEPVPNVPKQLTTTQQQVEQLPATARSSRNPQRRETWIALLGFAITAISVFLALCF